LYVITPPPSGGVGSGGERDSDGVHMHNGDNFGGGGGGGGSGGGGFYGNSHGDEGGGGHAYEQGHYLWRVKRAADGRLRRAALHPNYIVSHFFSFFFVLLCFVLYALVVLRKRNKCSIAFNILLLSSR
jgi:hypothetical protein